jgi:pyruvate formate lyase activating enzyme
MDSDKHVRFTGVSNERILTNLQVLSRQEAEIVIRFPIIPGFNSDQENIDKTGAFISSLPGVSRIHILPYHCAATAKYKNLGLNFNTSEVAKPTRDFLVSIARRLEIYKLKVKIGG